MSVIGLRVGPFEIVEPASVPEEGTWFVARRTGITTRQPAEVLVKLLRPDATNPERVDLQREFETLRTLDDPRVPAPVAFYEGSGALAVTVVQGAVLQQVVKRRRAGSLTMTPATLLDLALDLAEVLQHAHLRGRHHGHLSAQSVLLGADGRLWVFGFGPGPEVTPPERWMPPERARGEPSSVLTDQWSLGAVLASLVTGHVPWRGSDPVAQAVSGDAGDAVCPVEKQWPALGRLLRRLMEPLPANRFPAMSPVRQEILALSRKAGGVSDRRDLGALLAAESAGEAPPVRSSAQAPKPPPSPGLSLPREPLPVVRPDVGTQVPDLPHARLGTDADVAEDPTEMVDAAQVLERAPTEMMEPMDPLERAPTEMAAPVAPLERAPTEVAGPDQPSTPEEEAPTVDFEPSVRMVASVLVRAEAVRSSGEEADAEATLVVDARELLAAARAAAEARDPARLVPRGDARIQVDPKQARRSMRDEVEADEEPTALTAQLTLDASAVLEAVGEDAAEATLRVGFDAHVLADALASSREQDQEATVLLDGAALIEALRAATAAQREITEEVGEETTQDHTQDAVLVVEPSQVQVQIEPTDPDEPAPAQAQVQIEPTDPGEDEGPQPLAPPKPSGPPTVPEALRGRAPVHATAATVVPPSDPIGDADEEPSPFHSVDELDLPGPGDLDDVQETPALDVGAPRGLTIQRVAPWLVGVMVLLMVIALLWNVLT